MIVELGHFSLVLGLALALALAVLPLAGLVTHRERLMACAPSIAVGQCLFVLISFGCLMYAFAADDFSVAYVARNSNLALPLQFKLSAVWGAHEGSFLFWTLFLTIWTMLVGIFTGGLTTDMLARVMTVLGVISTGFIAFVLLTSNPFERLLPVSPGDGSDLNPLLQDFGLIIHPPMLYIGYVGFAVPFAFAIATLSAGRLDAAWARWSRPWTVAAWSFLTLGISFGSWWAYYELGWGGWWFWDAVENASFMPWLLGTALIHSLAVTEKRGVFRSWTVLLAIFTFSLSLLGAFLVRSGVLVSVHAFAVDPERGMYILAFLTFVIGGSLLLFALRAGRIRSHAGFSFRSREMLLMINNLFLVVACAAVLMGTLSPLVYEAMTDGGKISVGPPYFNLVFVPLVLVLFVFMGVSPHSRWRDTPLGLLLRRQMVLAACSLVTVAVLLLVAGRDFEWVVLFIDALAVWIVANLVADAWQRVSNKRARLRALLSQPPSWYGMWLAHAGMAVCIIGVATTVYYSEERDVRMTPGDETEVSGYGFKLASVSSLPGPNYDADQGVIEVTSDGKIIATLLPEKRRYRSGGNVMTEAAIDEGLFRDVFVALGEPVGDGAWAVRIHVKPFVRWIWFGGVLIAAGGMITLFDRRYRVLRERRDVAVQDLCAAPARAGA